MESTLGQGAAPLPARATRKATTATTGATPRCRAGATTGTGCATAATTPGDLSKVVKRYLRPHVTPDSVVMEIGPGGGRWTQFLIGAREVVLVELNTQFFRYLRKRFRRYRRKLRFYQTSGYELNGIDDGSIDFVFSFGTFVHIDPDGIDEYLGEIARVLRSGGTGTIQYADRDKPFLQTVPDFGGFSDMNAPKMEGLVAARGLEIVEHDRALLDHSNVVVIRKPAPA